MIVFNGGREQKHIWTELIWGFCNLLAPYQNLNINNSSIYILHIYNPLHNSLNLSRSFSTLHVELQSHRATELGALHDHAEESAPRGLRHMVNACLGRPQASFLTPCCLKHKHEQTCVLSIYLIHIITAVGSAFLKSGQ